MRMRSHVGGGLPPIGPQDHQRFSDRRHFLRQPKKSSGQASAFSFLEAVEVPLLPQGKKRRSPACCFSWVGAGNVADLKSAGGLEGQSGASPLPHVSAFSCWNSVKCGRGLAPDWPSRPPPPWINPTQIHQYHYRHVLPFCHTRDALPA